MASKPVANTMASTSCSLPLARTPFAVIASIGSSLTSISSTLARLNVS